jgi:hypothetical protein
VGLIGLLIAALAAHSSYGEILPVPEPADDGDAASQGVLVYGPWGSAPGQFGKVDDASRPGPMDFAVTEDTLYVLDPVNARVQLFDLDGRFRCEIPIATRTADFMCVDAAGNVTVLDAFVRREFKTFSETGELMVHARVPASIRLPSAVFAHGERIWIEERHNRVYELRVDRDDPGALVRIAGVLPGRPLARDNSVVRVRKAGPHEVVMRLGDPEESGKDLTLRFPRPVSSIVGLETDNSRQLYVAAACLRAPAIDQWSTDLLLVVITPEGRIADTLRMPNAYVTDHYRKVCVSGTGEIIQMQTTEDEVRFVRWTLPGRTGPRRAR